MYVVCVLFVNHYENESEKNPTAIDPVQIPLNLVNQIWLSSISRIGAPLGLEKSSMEEPSKAFLHIFWTNSSTLHRQSGDGHAGQPTYQFSNSQVNRNSNASY